MNEAPTKRLFFALWPDASVRARLAHIGKACQVAGARCVAAEHLHCTLVFLGAVTAQQQSLLETGASRIRAETFTLRVDCTGHWPRSRVVWAGVSSVPPEVLRLQAALAALARDSGLAVEQRRYVPHITLVRNASGLLFDELAQPIAWDIREFLLMESRSTTSGVCYQPLSVYRLST